MLTPHGHLTYCSNIHPGEKWEDHFKALKQNLPFIRQQLVPGKPFGLGLRIAHEASLALSKPEVMQTFKNWLTEEDIYIFVINGFPYGDFHDSVVKDQVHTPDWTTPDRLDYTIRLFKILAQLLPNGMEGGVSTPPLSYRLWWKTDQEKIETVDLATANVLVLLEELIQIEKETGKFLHLDIEPEPDGIFDSTRDFVAWYETKLLPEGSAYLQEKLNISQKDARSLILRHIQLCYDICHAAVGYEQPEEILASLAPLGIQVGRIQISSALKVDFTTDSELKYKAIQTFNEPIYLHQVVTRNVNHTHTHYADLPQALANWNANQEEWRVHFHVPLFTKSYGLLDSTQSDIVNTLAIHARKPFSPFLEVETYTWGVLPEDMQKPMDESIVRELEWVRDTLNKTNISV
jgi:hypothetical protein